LKAYRINDTITIKVAIAEKVESSQMLVLEINITNQNSKKVIRGKAKSLCSPTNPEKLA
jgi:hypothetical protein